MLKNHVEVSNSWKEYLEELLNVEDDREVEENCLGMYSVRNESEVISMEEVRSALRNI